MEHQNKNTQQYKYDRDFVEFRNHVNTVIYDLEIMAYMAANDRKDFFTEGCLNQFIYDVKVHAVAFFNDVQMEDDEYGTLAYVGYARDYRQALENFRAWLDETVGARPIFYEGELNSYSWRLDSLIEYESRKSVHGLNGEKNIEEIDDSEEDEDLPF